MTLFEFAFFPNYDESVRGLAEKLADKEEWDFSDAKVKKYPILKNYVDHTFRKVYLEGSVSFSTDNKKATFNTGLVTKNLEEIFAFFEINKGPRAKAQWFFKGFFKKSDHYLLTNFKSNLPDRANFFNQPELLIFNPKCELIPDIDHIIEDNAARFPTHMNNAGDAEMRRKLQGAIEEVKMLVKTNYKVAIPQFYKNNIQLLLPLCLTPGSNIPDMALVVYKIDHKSYSARTCLTLKMAYNNARLIVKPQSDWLKP